MPRRDPGWPVREGLEGIMVGKMGRDGRDLARPCPPSYLGMGGRIQGAAHRPPREGELHAARFRAKWYRQVIRHRFDRKPVQCAAHRPPCEGYTNGNAQAKTRYGKAIRHKVSHSRCFSAHLCQNLVKTSPSRLPRPENKPESFQEPA